MAHDGDIPHVTSEASYTSVLSFIMLIKIGRTRISNYNKQDYIMGSKSYLSKSTAEFPVLINLVDKKHNSNEFFDIYYNSLFFKCSPLNMDDTEVPKYTCRLLRFQIQLRGTLIGLRLESLSAKTCFK